MGVESSPGSHRSGSLGPGHLWELGDVYEPSIYGVVQVHKSSFGIQGKGEFQEYFNAEESLGHLISCELQGMQEKGFDS